jgi:hypothetical protein
LHWREHVSDARPSATIRRDDLVQPQVSLQRQGPGCPVDRMAVRRQPLAHFRDRRPFWSRADQL